MDWAASLDDSRDVMVIEGGEGVDLDWRVRDQGIGDSFEALSEVLVSSRNLLADQPRLARLTSLCRCRASSGVHRPSFRTLLEIQQGITAVLTGPPTIQTASR